MKPREVKALREALRMTQSELAEKLGLRHKSQVRHLESGRTEITGPKLVILQQLQAGLRQFAKT